MQVKAKHVEPVKNQVIVLPDGRKLGYILVGKGKPVVYFHGTSSSRLEAMLLEELAYNSQLQIISIDRPGYGLSTFTPQKNLHVFANDVNFLVNHLDIDRCGVLGWSGGGVFALAYAALFPERISKVVAVGSPALPFDVTAAHNMPFARFAMKVPFLGFLALKRMSSQILKANANVDAFLKSKHGKNLIRGLSESDEKFLSDPKWVTLMYASMAEAFRQGNIGVKAVLQEHQLFMGSWNISFSRVPADNVFVWQGAEDKTCRVDNAYRIAEAIGGLHLEIFEVGGHCILFSNLDRLGYILGS